MQYPLWCVGCWPYGWRWVTILVWQDRERWEIGRRQSWMQGRTTLDRMWKSESEMQTLGLLSSKIEALSFLNWPTKTSRSPKAPLRCSLNPICQNYPKTMTTNVKWANLKVHPRLLEKFGKRGRGGKDYSAQPFPVLICTGAHFPIHWRALAVVTGVRTPPTHPPESV